MTGKSVIRASYGLLWIGVVIAVVGAVLFVLRKLGLIDTPIILHDPMDLVVLGCVMIGGARWKLRQTKKDETASSN